MARRVISDGQELIIEDLNSLQALKEQEFYDRVLFQMLQRVENAFFQDSFKVNFIDATNVSITAGLGFQTVSSVANTEPTKRPVYSSVNQNATISDPDLVHDRIDLICVKTDRAVTETDTRKYKATIGGSITSTTFNVRDDWTTDLLVVTGTPANVPTAPSVTTGYIALSQVYIHAVTGMAGQSDCTDVRTKLPVSGDIFYNTNGYLRLTAGAAVPASTLFSDIDRLLKTGYQNYTDFDNLSADPSAPATSSNKIRMYLKGGVGFFQDETGAKTPIGSGGGGGGGANWVGDAGTSPLEAIENGEKVWLFESGAGQKLSLFVKVPQGYITGRQIFMFLGQYSPSTSGTQLLVAKASLVRKNLDGVDSVANQYTSTNTALTNTVANQYRQSVLDLNSPLGKINGFNVTFGDILRIDLTRSSDTDTADVRFIPSATEVKFS